MENNNNEKKLIKLDIPFGYKIDTKRSNFNKGEIILTETDYTIDSIIEHWNSLNNGNKNRDFNKVSKFLYDFAPAEVYCHYVIKVVCAYFRDVVALDAFHDTLQKGNYVIRKNDNSIQKVNKDEITKGTIVFGSYQEAFFVDKIMRRNFNEIYTWSKY